jgi:hypothetical protein
MDASRSSLRWLGAGLVIARKWWKVRRSRSVPIAIGTSPPRLKPSDPDAASPNLVRIDRLGRPVRYRKGSVPDFREECGAGENYRVVELIGLRGRFVVHLYNGSTARVQAMVFGSDGQRAVALSKCMEAKGVVTRIEVQSDRNHPRYFLRIGIQTSEKRMPEEDYVAVAVYQQEPRARGGISYTRADGERITLPFSHDGRSFQRVVLTSCDENVDDLKGFLQRWADNTGLEQAESYFGPKGGVIALGVPPGLDPDTIGGATTRVRPKENTNGTAEADYIVNLLNPRKPTDTSGKERPSTDRRKSGDPFSGYGDWDEELDPLLISVIDGGVDNGPHNAPIWQPSRYRSGPETDFIQRGNLGYDFIDKDTDPDDVIRHGTYVAGAIVGGYRGKRPLQLLHFKIFGPEGISSYFGSLVGIFESAALGCDLINMSWGFYADEAPPALRCAIQVAVREGCFLVASAGNDKADLEQTPQWPAAFSTEFPKHLITVGAYAYAGGQADAGNVQLLDFSNYGKTKVTVAAHETARVPEPGSPEPVYPRGTSISAPIVTATFAQYLSEDPRGNMSGFRRRFTEAPALATGTGTGKEVSMGRHLALSDSAVLV